MPNFWHRFFDAIIRFSLNYNEDSFIQTGSTTKEQSFQLIHNKKAAKFGGFIFYECNFASLASARQPIVPALLPSFGVTI